MFSKIELYTSGSFKNKPGRSDNKNGIASASVSCAEDSSFNQCHLLKDLDKNSKFVATPARAKLWSVVLAMREILKRIEGNWNYAYTVFTIIADDKNVIKYITEWGPSYRKDYGNQYKYWKGSYGQKIQDARLLNEAMKLHRRIHRCLDIRQIGGFYLVYHEMDRLNQIAREAYHSSRNAVAHATSQRDMPPAYDSVVKSNVHHYSRQVYFPPPPRPTIKTRSWAGAFFVFILKCIRAIVLFYVVITMLSLGLSKLANFPVQS